MTIPAEKQFETELSACFQRWYEESDLDELEMAHIAIAVIERFTDVTVEFDSEIDLDAIEDEPEE
ncbi:MAG: hypothetical protein CL532_01505 [Aestuariivita sp.]|nr:hypothetical protein [Aestuariivita sp.]|tara:strand:+ start:1133 stop:1327 length:195 start_codon:yes stop_codon:yes gene_type:complete